MAGQILSNSNCVYLIGLHEDLRSALCLSSVYPAHCIHQVQEEAARQQAPSYGKQAAMGPPGGVGVVPGVGVGAVGVGPGGAGAVRPEWAARYRTPVPPLHHPHHPRLPHHHQQPPHPQHPHPQLQVNYYLTLTDTLVH